MMNLPMYKKFLFKIANPILSRIYSLKIIIKVNRAIFLEMV